MLSEDSHLMDTNCAELYRLSLTMEKGIKSPLEGINQDNLNYSPSKNKMSIGQLAVHSTGWAQYFLADKKWEPVKWTCVSVTYPLKLETVLNEVDKGFSAIRNTLSSINDNLLERKMDGSKGYGYIIYRLLIHAMTHANQMAYLRQVVEPEWSFGKMFGEMATTIINTKYYTSPDINVPGF